MEEVTTYEIGSHYRTAFKVGSQFAWIDCTLCDLGPKERIKGTWPIITTTRRIFPELDSEPVTDILTLLSGLETHTLWHLAGNTHREGGPDESARERV